MIKTFVINVSLFGLLCLVSFVFVYFLADGSTDANYLRFTTGKQSSLVIGGSRAAQGIQPYVINRNLNNVKMYNYAFQNPSSPYGEIYLNSIKRKIRRGNDIGVFILEVNPWNLMNYRSRKSLQEANSFIAKTTFVNFKPNFEYLIESFAERNLSILENKIRKGNNMTYYLNEDGWLEVTLDEPNEMVKLHRKKHKIEKYKSRINDSEGLSSYRLQFLDSTIAYLKSFGEVYLVRMPVSVEMQENEKKLCPDFDKVMDSISLKSKSIYYNFLINGDENSDFTDGHHLDKESGACFTLQLLDSIKTRL
ncbi:hypothetical protein [Mangrovimonas xylaniphaga]|uniref:hypothetical protein n=1 Tax=Mangrovimonas xylaniphaga TaxID=1645915 RepID=UPI0006B5C034|nr:hypothetical protein [Mangrovimonas xylaniphaga]